MGTRYENVAQAWCPSGSDLWKAKCGTETAQKLRLYPNHTHRAVCYRIASSGTGALMYHEWDVSSVRWIIRSNQGRGGSLGLGSLGSSPGLGAQSGGCGEHEEEARGDHGARTDTGEGRRGDGCQSRSLVEPRSLLPRCSPPLCFDEMQSARARGCERHVHAPGVVLFVLLFQTI
uniref:Uncharacterized protein n=1 Tax=Knipowitschia caucasica TaxID=637954 RepID=A0AAV2KVD3_KNICA